jgi:hypothetical protein
VIIQRGMFYSALKFKNKKFIFKRFWDGTVCFPKRTLNEICSDDSHCRSYENLICKNKICKSRS